MKIAIVMELDTASYAQSKYGSDVSFDEVRSWVEEEREFRATTVGH